MNIAAAKKWLRIYLLRSRGLLGRRKQTALSRKIARTFLRLPEFKKAKTVAAYLGFGSEVLTEDIVRRAWQMGKTVLVPVTRRGFRNPYFAKFTPADPLAKTRYGPLEPRRKTHPHPFKQIDLVLVPGLGFDSKGWRLGFGAGVYDRLLKKTSRALHIGLCFSVQKLNRIPREKNDKRLGAILDENGCTFTTVSNSPF